jgi:perosamine synthetase
MLPGNELFIQFPQDRQMRVGKTIPPAAAPLSPLDILNGLLGGMDSKERTAALQRSICNKFETKHCFLLSSGKAAITLVLEVLAEMSPDRNHVIIPAFDCYSVPSAIFRAGLSIIPCDINPETLQFDEEKLLEILKDSSKILALLPTHLFGLPTDMNQIRKLCVDKKIAIIEDAAQAMGSQLDGKYLGTNGDVGIFSFARGKVISAGSGGVIITDRDDLASLIKSKVNSIPDCSFVQLLKLFIESMALTILINPYLYWIPKMFPFLKLGETIFDPDFPIHKFSGFQAGLVKNWEKKMEFFVKERQKKVSLYSELLSGIKNLSLISDHWKRNTLSCIRFPVIIHHKQKIKEILLNSKKMGLGISETYPGSVETIPNARIKQATLPSINAQTMTLALLTLPCHSLTSRSDIIKITTMIKNVLER